MKTAIRLFFNPYLFDRRYTLVISLLIVGLGCGLFLFEYWRNPAHIQLGTMWYFVILSGVLIVTWLVVNFIRFLPYYKRLDVALHSDERLESVYLVEEERTREQQMTKQLLLSLQGAYDKKLNQLQQSQDMRHQFTLQWVHQMKTPLAVIDMQMQQAKLDYSAVEESDQIDMNKLLLLFDSVAEETNRLEHGLNMMLHTSRLEKFEIDLQVRKLNLHQLVRDVVNSNKKMCIQYHIYPKVEGEAVVESDTKWLSFVLQQLVGNAIKYSKLKEGSKSLNITIKKLGDDTQLCIADEGIGIEPQDIRRVFDPFFTGHNGRITGESTGMGLYLCKQICQRLGHPIDISSEKGKGTKVVLYFKSQALHRL